MSEFTRPTHNTVVKEHLITSMQETRERILDELNAGPRSGPELASALDISRAAVWKHMEALRDAGFSIESSEAGYEITAVPEFGAHAIEFGLSAPYRIQYHESVESTNATARELARAGRRDIVVVADEQTGGRGRLDREWRSPSGGIWASILFEPDIPVAHSPVFTLAAAVATARAARSVGVDATIKWPNDVLVGEQKLAGILSEMEGEADRLSWLVIGIGLNANLDSADLPEHATSIQSEVGSCDRALLTRTLLEEFHALRTDPDKILPAWRELSATLSTAVCVETPSETVRGTAVDIAYPGQLVIETQDGTEVVSTGDCEHLRPDSESEKK